jgi:hypothetical protein
MQTARTIKLNETEPGTVRFLSGLHVTLEDGKTKSWVTVTRTGSFDHPVYGRFEISKPLLLQLVENFKSHAYGQDVFYDVAHKPENGAAGKILDLKVEGDRLRALVEWTPYGIDAIKSKGYAYSSIEYHENYKDNESGKVLGPVLLGAGLVTRPHVKRLDPIQLAECGAGNVPTLLHPELQTTLLAEITIMHKKLIAQLLAMLTGLKLAEPVAKCLTEAFEKAVAPITVEADAIALMTSFEDSGKKLAAEIGDRVVTLSITAPEIKGGLTAEDVRKLMQQETDRLETERKALADKTAGNVKLLTDTISAATGLDESTKKELAAAVSDLVNAEMTAEQVIKLAEVQITQGNKLVAAKKLQAQGYQFPSGTVHIEVPTEAATKLDGIYRDNLKKTSSFALGKIKLADKAHPFVSMVLGEFDRLHAEALHSEVKMLSGDTSMANTNLPVGFKREVIREALSDLNILALVNTMMDPSATQTTQIPYEMRDVSGVYNEGIVYEGQEIHRAGISQAMDTAYIQAMKIAMLISNEVIHFSRASGINWDAMGRNLESNARFMRELVARRIANELQRSADAYAAVAVVAEAIDSQINGATSVIKTANYPIVRPYQARDLQGTAIGNPENPIALTINGTARSAYDGTGEQAAGIYYRVINYNLGYVQLVDETGAPVTPSDSGVNTISYSRATNIVKVDLDVPSGSTLEKQLNKALQAIGGRKAMLNSDRYVVPDFQLMSPTLNDTLTNAEQFVEAGQRADASVSSQGDLTTVKGLAAFGTNAPGIDLGDERILIGQRGLLGYAVAKPFMFGEPFEAVGPNGKPIGKKQAYGEEYSAIKVPTPVRDRLTSVLVYSFTGR